MKIITTPEEMEDYLSDASNISGGNTEKIFLPESEEEICSIMREAYLAKTPVTISGARTGTVGGAIPFGGYVISLEKLNNIKEVDQENLKIVLECGVLLSVVHQVAEDAGMFYPPDPTEWSCQIGGNVATNATGARSFKYGPTRNFVQELRVVLANGHIVKLKRGEVFSENGKLRITTEDGEMFDLKIPTYERPKVRKNVSGYFNVEPLDAIDLFIGSEGTLGVITEITLSLLPKPEGFFSGIVFFEAEADLLDFVAAARTASVEALKTSGDGDLICATLMEYFDGNSLRFIHESFPDAPTDAAGAIFFEQETTPANEDVLLEAWNALFERYNADLDRSWFATTEQDRDRMRKFRHALPVAVNERIRRNRQRKLGSDMAVPEKNFRQFLNFYRKSIEQLGLEYVIFGHIGDCHVHANTIPRNESEAIIAKRLYGRFIAQAVMLGGVVSAEHGIGKLKRDYLNVMLGERYLNEMAELKKILDPHCILGRGNMFAEKFLR